MGKRKNFNQDPKEEVRKTKQKTLKIQRAPHSRETTAVTTTLFVFCYYFDIDGKKVSAPLFSFMLFLDHHHHHPFSKPNWKTKNGHSDFVTSSTTNQSYSSPILERKQKYVFSALQMGEEEKI
jgi:hypothetical protein